MAEQRARKKGQSASQGLWFCSLTALQGRGYVLKGGKRKVVGREGNKFWGRKEGKGKKRRGEEKSEILSPAQLYPLQRCEHSGSCWSLACSVLGLEPESGPCTTCVGLCWALPQLETLWTDHFLDFPESSGDDCPLDPDEGCIRTSPTAHPQVEITGLRDFLG